MNTIEFRQRVQAIKSEMCNLEGEALREKETELKNLREEFANETAVLQREQVEAKNDMSAKNFREAVMNAKSEGKQREISLGTLATQQAAQSIANGAEAQNVVVMPVLPVAEAKNIYGFLGMKQEKNVPTDKIVWPYNTNAVALEDRGEADAAAEVTLDWSNKKPDPYSASLSIAVDNEAIDNASFDLHGYVVGQLMAAKDRYINKKTLASCPFTGLKGPFSSNNAPSAIDGSWKNIKKETAKVSAAGVSMEGFCYFGNALTTAILETTPKANGQGGFVLENGKIGGYPYYESEYACLKRTGSGTSSSPYVYSYDSTNAYFGFGPFALLALVGHGTEKLVIDPVTLAHKNQTRFILHTKNSLTNLNTSSATVFKMFKLNDVSDTVAVSGTITTQQAAAE